jgi:hypothetical protein
VGLFLKACWNTVKKDIYKLCFELYEWNLNLASVNMGHIALVPKVATPEGINDCRPITLLNCIMRIVTTLLANRLQQKVLKQFHKN